jgi:hypothetical protein
VELNDSAYYAHLMSDFERQVGWAAIAREKADASGRPAMAPSLAERCGRGGDAEVDAVLSVGSEVFRRAVCHHLLAERGGEVKSNRCLHKYRRVAFTPAARQGFRCGHDWHGTHG